MDISVDAHTWGREVEFRVKQNDHNNVIVQVRSKNYPSVTLYMEKDQLIKLAIEIEDFLQEQSLAKALPNPPEEDGTNPYLLEGEELEQTVEARKKGGKVWL